MLQSLTRTIVPVIVGALVSLVPSLDTAAAGSVVTTLVAVVYYAVARWLETNVGDVWGWLLGAKGAPTY